MQTNLYSFCSGSEQPCCHKCGATGVPLFEEWYSDFFQEGFYCEICIDNEHRNDD